MKLIIIRHGEAEFSAATGLDKDRELTENGIADIGKIGNFIVGSSLKIHRIYHSPYRRTLQTAEILHEKLEIPELPVLADNDLMPGCDYMKFLPTLTSFSNSETVVIVGHNPDVAFFAAQLLKDISLQAVLLFQPGTCMGINIAKERFFGGQLIWYISPNNLA